jgi:hypothetical protein
MKMWNFKIKFLKKTTLIRASTAEDLDVTDKKINYLWNFKTKFLKKTTLIRASTAEDLDVTDKKINYFYYIFKLNPPSPGGTAILPEYIHYYGYYYQVIVQC